LDLDMDDTPIEGQDTTGSSSLNEPVSEELVATEIRERAGTEAHTSSPFSPSPIDQTPPQELFKARDEQDSKPSLLIPSVRHLLAKLEIDVADVQGTGKNGRITKEDVQRHHSVKAASSNGDSATPTEKISHVSTASAEDRLVPLTATNKIMFKTMTRSLSIPQFLYTHSVNIGAVNSLRKRLNSSSASKSKPKLTPLPFILKALSQALIEMPQLNAHLDDSDPSKPALLLKAAHHFGIAIDTPRGLLVPVVRNVEQHSISSLAREIQRLGVLAKDGELGAEHFKDATFTVSNVGSIGGGVVSPIIVAPQVGIVAVGRMKEVPAFDCDEHGKDIVVKREELVLSWSADHRVLDGATVARCAELVGRLVADVGEMTVSLH
jgi:2-oxoisovalerate dehydrogenase E2 component (dihydrolipoyl transacylase)